MPVNLPEYFALLSQRLQADLQAARFFTSSTDIGGVNESALRQVMKPLLPAKYNIGIGEVIIPSTSDTERLSQSGQKDIVIYDPYASPIFGWGDSGLSLFPIESVYALIEVKTCFNKIADIQMAATQLYEVKQLQKQYAPQIEAPTTIAFAYASTVKREKVFQVIQEMPTEQRPDMTIYLGSSKKKEQPVSAYITHWHFTKNGPGEIGFVTSDEAVASRESKDSRAIYLTLSETTNTLLWFYLFLIRRLQMTDQQIDKSRVPNLFRYAFSSQVDLGYIQDESYLLRNNQAYRK